eukprot:Amastigsp_a513985_7.p3 type:complete len:259 gc:universal Amastigsp_a513985_7:261-1037(+)
MGGRSFPIPSACSRRAVQRRRRRSVLRPQGCASQAHGAVCKPGYRHRGVRAGRGRCGSAVARPFQWQCVLLRNVVPGGDRVACCAARPRFHGRVPHIRRRPCYRAREVQRVLRGQRPAVSARALRWLGAWRPRPSHRRRARHGARLSLGVRARRHCAALGHDREAATGSPRLVPPRARERASRSGARAAGDLRLACRARGAGRARCGRLLRVVGRVRRAGVCGQADACGSEPGRLRCDRVLRRQSQPPGVSHKHRCPA